jgi:hypothetical protein
VLTTSESGEPRQVFQKEFAPLYRLLRPTGAEVYADIPSYFEIEGTGTGDLTTSLIGFIGLPILPSERLSVGDSWQAAIDMMSPSIMDVRRTGNAAERIPARGTFESVEWERGEPCAKLSYELTQAVGNRQSRELELAGREFKDNDRLRILETAWVSLRSGKLVRLDAVIEADTKVANPNAAGGGGGDTGGGRFGPAPIGGGGSRGGPAPIGGGVGSIKVLQGGGSRGGRFGAQGVEGGGGPGQGNQGGGNQGGGSGGNDLFIRQKFYMKMVLE